VNAPQCFVICKMPILINVHALQIVTHEQIVYKKPCIALRQAAEITVSLHSYGPIGFRG
jgi:hypothetical protein